MTRRPTGSIVANPILVGAVTMLVTIVAVFLAYNANNGLPFVPTRTVYVDLPSGAELNRGVEVREGGYRIGVVTNLEPKRLPSGTVGARVEMRLDGASGPYPVDSKILVRPRAPLALKIVEFERGRSEREIPEGGRVPAENTDIATDLDELYSLFDRRTRLGARDQTTGFGTAVAGRGGDLSETISTLPRFFGLLEPVMRNLSDRRANLPDFINELADFTRVLAPVAREQVRVFRNSATTFDAISRDPDSLRATIEKSPPTLDTTIASLRVQRPFLRDTAAFSRDLEAAATDLRAALPIVNEALEVGTPVTRRTVQMNDDLEDTLGALGELAQDPFTNGSVRGLTANATTLGHTTRYLGPFITVCNYWNIFWTLAAEHLSSPDPTGSSQRVLFNSTDEQNDDVGAMGANEFVTGKGLKPPNGIRQYLHGNTAGGNAISPDGTADCTPGQQGYTYSANANDPTEEKFYRRAVVDQLNGLTPGTLPPKGPTFDHFDREGKGVGVFPAPRVPEGQTFTDIPGGRAALFEHERRILAERGERRP